MKNLNMAISEIDDNIKEIKEREDFLDALQIGCPLIIKKENHPARMFVLSDEEKEILKQFSLKRIKELRKATFVDDKDIEIRND